MKAKIFLMTMFAALTIGAVGVSAEEDTGSVEGTEEVVTDVYEEPTETTSTTVTELTEPTETTVSTTVTSAVSDSDTTVTTTTEQPEMLLGDANGDGIINIRDCAFIAHKLVEGKTDELILELADVNGDGKINVRDAAALANKLCLNITSTKVDVDNKKPNKSDYDLNTFTGKKNYVNDMIIYIATTKYGVGEIKADDSIDVNDAAWYAPTEYIPNEEYYSKVTSVKEYGFEGCFPACYVTTVDDLISDAEQGLVTISNRICPDGSYIDMSQERMRIEWLPIDDGGNYEVYIIYGGWY